MSWQGIEGHDDLVEQFRVRLKLGRFASTFLFVGPDGVGKRTFARKLAQTLLCHVHETVELAPCGTCENCVQMLAGTHPDLLQVAKPADKSEIPVALFIGSKERRMQEGLLHDIWMKPTLGGRRIAIIDDADLLNEEGANSLLKTLEEPPPNAVIILIGTSLERQLPTIRSRSQIVRFQPLDAAVVARLLVEHQLIDDPTAAERLAAHCDGSLARAVELSDAPLWDFRRTLLGKLADPGSDSLSLAKQFIAFVEDAGKEASARRARARIVMSFVVDFYRSVARGLVGGPAVNDSEVNELVQRACQNWPGDVDTAVACTERTLEALSHLDRYANQATLIEGWLDELSALTTPPAKLKV